MKIYRVSCLVDLRVLCKGEKLFPVLQIGQGKALLQSKYANRLDGSYLGYTANRWSNSVYMNSPY